MAVFSEPRPEPSLANDYCVEHINLLIDSFQHYTGRNLVDPSLRREEAAREIFYAPFVVVSHDTAADPIFTYGNQTALSLFEMTWPEFTSLPSKQSAEPPNQEERAALLATVSRQGYIDNYSGIRMSKGGKRFVIEQVTVWNLRDRHHQYQGQAAVYSSWTYL
jgi:MEKHLA domain